MGRFTSNKGNEDRTEELVKGSISFLIALCGFAKALRYMMTKKAIELHSTAAATSSNLDVALVQH